MKNLQFKIVSLLAVAGLFLSVAPAAFAHSVVTPKQVGIAATQDFTLSVPTEKDGSTVSVKLMIPPGVDFVTPVIKAGWKIEVKSGPIPSGETPPKAMDGDVAESIPTEIDWTGGNIPAEQKDEFVFTAQVPAQAGELDWKVYQGYADGSTVAWNLGPNDPQPKDSDGNPNFDASGPYSTTMVVNDLTGSGTTSGMNSASSNAPVAQASTQSNLPLILSLVALALSASAWMMARKKN